MTLERAYTGNHRQSCLSGSFAPSHARLGSTKLGSFSTCPHCEGSVDPLPLGPGTLLRDYTGQQRRTLGPAKKAMGIPEPLDPIQRPK